MKTHIFTKIIERLACVKAYLVRRWDVKNQGVIVGLEVPQKESRLPDQSGELLFQDRKGNQEAGSLDVV